MGLYPFLSSCKNLPFNFKINFVWAWLLVAVIRVFESPNVLAETGTLLLLGGLVFEIIVMTIFSYFPWGLTQSCISFFRHINGASICIQEFHCGSINKVSSQAFSIQGASLSSQVLLGTAAGFLRFLTFRWERWCDIILGQGLQCNNVQCRGLLCDDSVRSGRSVETGDSW